MSAVVVRRDDLADISQVEQSGTDSSFYCHIDTINFAQTDERHAADVR